MHIYLLRSISIYIHIYINYQATAELLQTQRRVTIIEKITDDVLNRLKMSIYICIYAFIYINIYIYTYIHVFKYISVYMYMKIYICIYIYIYIYICIG
jgi:hypothetical protein